MARNYIIGIHTPTYCTHTHAVRARACSTNPLTRTNAVRQTIIALLLLDSLSLLLPLSNIAGEQSRSLDANPRSAATSSPTARPSRAPRRAGAGSSLGSERISVWCRSRRFQCLWTAFSGPLTLLFAFSEDFCLASLTACSELLVFCCSPQGLELRAGERVLAETQ